MKQKNYSEYSSLDFAMDDNFIQWVKSPDVSSSDFWDRWISDNPKKVLEISDAIELLKSIDFKKHKPSQYEMNNVWLGIERQMDRKPEQGFLRLSFMNSIVFKIAAVLVLILGIFFSYTEITNQFNGVQAEVVLMKETPKGMKATFRLSDGSIVKLNAGSKLYYSNDFNLSTRVVELEGEAYFQVAHNSEKPFIVKTGNISTKVLGTTFNIKSYPEEQMQYIALEEGKVQVDEKENGEIVYKQILKPSEMLVYNRANKRHKVTVFNKASIMGWKDNAIVFNDASFKDIKKELERWYGVEILADVHVAEESGFTGKFYNENLTNVLSNISLAMGFNFSIQNKQVTITKK